MKAYEVMYIVKPVEEEAFEAVVAKFENLINTNGGNLSEGLYVLVTFQANAACVKELDRVMKITDEVLRHMIIRKGE